MDIRRSAHSRAKASETGAQAEAEAEADDRDERDVSQVPVAVVGLACRYPDADDVAGLFQMIINSRRAFRRIPPSRIDLADYYSSDQRTPDATYSTRAALIEGWRFDRAAFGVSQATFLSAEPAHWLALETSARALAAAGFPGGTGLPAERTGVFVGGPPGGGAQPASLRLRWPYSRQVITEALAAARAPADLSDRILKAAAVRYLAPFPSVGADALTSSGPGPIAAAICDQFGFGGGGSGIDAGAASSLTAVASACSALAAGDLDAAVVGGVDVSLDPLNLVGLAQAGLLATGDMRIYDQDPTGFLPGEGCGMVLLMRTADAIAADLPVYAEILGCGVASSGHLRRTGRTSADPSAMLLALRRAYANARIDPVDVRLIEGCGTGAGPADEAELTALAMLRSGAKRPARIGAVTASIGNAGAAAGAAGLIKAVLATANGVLPPTVGVGTPHQILRDGGGCLRTENAPQPWPDGRGPRYAGVSARSLDGLTAHVVVRGTAGGRPGPAIAAASSRAASTGTGTAKLVSVRADIDRPSAFLVHAPDRRALIGTLTRIADVAPWLSDSQLHDLACQLAIEAADQGRVKVAIVATRPEQLGRLATEAITIVPKLTSGLVSTRPGIFAADDADGQVTLLLAGRPQDPAQPAEDQLRRALIVLRRLDELGVQPAAVVGHGVGELAGLVWAGCISAADARTLNGLRTAALTAPVTAAPGNLSSAIDEFAGFEFGAPRCRLYSGGTGAELVSATQIATNLSADLLNSRSAASTDQQLGTAVRSAAAGASLLLQAGRDRDLTRAIGQLAAPVPGPGQRRKIAVVCIDGDPADNGCLARAAAALFAAGALTKADLLYAASPARPIDIWREQVFITHPCQTPIALPHSPRPSPVTTQGRSPAAPKRSPNRTPVSDPAPACVEPATVEPPLGQPEVSGVAPWFRCYTEQIAEPADSITGPGGGPWRVYTGGRDALRTDVVELFRAEPSADRTLAVLGRPFDPAAVEAALLAAQDAIRTGRLLAISPHAGWAGLWASLRAEHPATGITTVRAGLDHAGLRAASLIGAAAGAYRELSIEDDGSVRELMMAPAEFGRAGSFPFGPGDVVLISRACGAAGLALTQVLACSGAAIVVIGDSRTPGPAHRDGLERDDAVIAPLERLRAAGAAISYEVVDPASATALDAAVRRIERRLGPVTAVAHAARTASPRAIASLTAADLRTQAVEETRLLDRLVTAARGPDRALRFIITFGPLAGRYGLAEGATAAVASGALADYAERLAAASPGGRAVHVDWSAAMPAAQGARLLLSALGGAAGLPRRIALHGRITDQAPRPIALGRPAGPAQPGRFTERVLVHYPRVELVTEAIIDTETDPYLSDYVVDGASLLPPAIAIEAMAEAARVLAGTTSRTATELSMAAPIVLSGQHPTAVIRLCALRDSDSVSVILRCDRTDFAVDHFRATFRPATTAVEPSPGLSRLPVGGYGQPTGNLKADDLYGPVLFQSGRFRRLTTVRFGSSAAATGLVDGADEQAWFTEPANLVLGHPAVTDAALQLAQVCVPHRRLMFGGCRSVTFTGRDRAGAVQLRATQVRVEPTVLVPRQRAGEPAGTGTGGGAGVSLSGSAETTWDIDAIDADGQPVLHFRGLVMKDAGPLPRTNPWPVALAGCFIERAVAELGLEPGLEVRVDRRSTAPRQRGADGWVRTSPSDVGPPGLILRVRASAPGQAACGWRVVKPTGRKSSASQGGRPPANPRSAGRRERPPINPRGDLRSAQQVERWFAVIEDRQAGLVSAGRPWTNWARAMALASCAGPAADPRDLTVELRPVAGTDWVLARGDHASLACAVIEVAGAPHPVAIAIMTGALDPGTAQGSSGRLALR